MPFGGLGGLGGWSPSFPQRTGAPISNVVERLPFATQDDWLADWQRRYDQEAAKAQGTEGYWANTPVASSYANSSMSSSSPYPQGEAGGMSAMSTTSDWPFQQWVEGSAGVAPDFTALEAERAKMLPRYTAKVGNQQAFDAMSGMHQMNGLPGPDYANANFGQVTGQANQPLNAQQGVDMGWATGVYDPNYASGMFGNSGASRNGSWL